MRYGQWDRGNKAKIEAMGWPGPEIQPPMPWPMQEMQPTPMNYRSYEAAPMPNVGVPEMPMPNIGVPEMPMPNVGVPEMPTPQVQPDVIPTQVTEAQGDEGPRYDDVTNRYGMAVGSPDPQDLMGMRYGRRMRDIPPAASAKDQPRGRGFFNVPNGR